jgi:signal transduction histidine kinase
VSLGATNGEVVLRVRDTGVGIAPEVLPFVFDAFVRDCISGGRPRRGSGVGLLLVRTLVELHGGRAEASSAGPGRGSEFVVRLPVTRWDLM